MKIDGQHKCFQLSGHDYDASAMMVPDVVRHAEVVLEIQQSTHTKRCKLLLIPTLLLVVLQRFLTTSTEVVALGWYFGLRGCWCWVMLRLLVVVELKFELLQRFSVTCA
jgi:hypothetical protein